MIICPNLSFIYHLNDLEFHSFTFPYPIAKQLFKILTCNHRIAMAFEKKKKKWHPIVSKLACFLEWAVSEWNEVATKLYSSFLRSFSQRFTRQWTVPAMVSQYRTAGWPAVSAKAMAIVNVSAVSAVDKPPSRVSTMAARCRVQWAVRRGERWQGQLQLAR